MQCGDPVGHLLQRLARHDDIGLCKHIVKEMTNHSMQYRYYISIGADVSLLFLLLELNGFY